MMLRLRGLEVYTLATRPGPHLKSEIAGAYGATYISTRETTLADLCQSVITDTPLGKVGVLIKAGGNGNPASASDLQIGMTGLKGDASFGAIRIGVDASTVNTDAKGSAGDFAQDADTVSIKNLQQTAWSTQASVFTLTGMTLELTDGSQGCF